MKELPNYIGIPDSAMMVKVPTVKIEYVTDNGVADHVFIKAGRYSFYYDDLNEEQINDVDKYHMVGLIKKAHPIICFILGTNEYKGDYKHPDGYRITNVSTIHVYECHGDGSSA